MSTTALRRVACGLALACLCIAPAAVAQQSDLALFNSVPAPNGSGCSALVTSSRSQNHVPCFMPCIAAYGMTQTAHVAGFCSALVPSTT